MNPSAPSSAGGEGGGNRWQLLLVVKAKAACEAGTLRVFISDNPAFEGPRVGFCKFHYLVEFGGPRLAAAWLWHISAALAPGAEQLWEQKVAGGRRVVEGPGGDGPGRGGSGWRGSRVGRVPGLRRCTLGSCSFLPGRGGVPPQPAALRRGETR